MALPPGLPLGPARIVVTNAGGTLTVPVVVVRVRFNGQPASPLFVGAHAVYPGRDQLNLQVPGSLRGAGQVDVSCTADGQTTNTVSIHLQ